MNDWRRIREELCSVQSKFRVSSECIFLAEIFSVNIFRKGKVGAEEGCLDGANWG